METYHYTGRVPPLDAVAGNTVPYQVFVMTAGRPRAVCRCGWIGRKRLTTAGAQLDSWLHAAKAGHMPATPLICIAPVRKRW